MTELVEELIRKYVPKGVVIDTNILLLYFVGASNRARISRFSRTKQFADSDYEVLTDFMSRFQKIATTPNILTEVSSLINQLDEPDRSSCYEFFAGEVGFLQESYLPSREVAAIGWPFQKYGLADSGIASLATNRYLVLTDDLKLARYLNSLNIDTLNFNNLRDY